ncbi:MAG: hypothetical protein ACTHU0_10460, partial [Kofleriaceae bacterium]
MREQLAEVVAALVALQQAFEELVVRGLASSGPDDLRRLQAIGDELGRAGAGYVAELIGALVRSAREAEADAPRALLRAQTAARVFERVVSLELAADQLGPPAAPSADAPDAPSEPPRAPPSGPAQPGPPPGAAEDRRALVPVLDELAGFVEGLIGSGMTTATAATKARLDASFKEASRLKLLRLATSLRYAGDECARFLADSEQFSARRLAFFLHRTWLISRGLREAIARGDHALLARLLWQSAPRPVKALTVAVIGVHKRALLDGSASFDFRMVALAGAEGIPRGTRLVWSCVFAARRGVPAEAFLHLPQPQKFTPKILLEPTQIVVRDAAATLDEHGSGRLMLGPKSTVTAGPAIADWDGLLAWDRARATARIRRHSISPL